MSRRQRIMAIKACNRPQYIYNTAGGQISCTAKQVGWQEFDFATVGLLQQCQARTYNYGYNVIAGDPANASGVQSDMLIDNYKANIQFKNNATGDCTFTFYEVLPRQHIDDTHSIINSLSATATDLVPQGALSANYLGWLDLGFHPYHSPKFRQYFRIRKTKTVVLRPGKTYTYSLMVNLNRVINGSWLLNADYTYLRGYSRALLCRMSGDIGVGTGVSGGITTAAQYIDYIHRQKYTIHSCPGLYGAGAYYSDNFGATPGQPIVVNSVNGMANLSWSGGTSTENAVLSHV